MHILCDWSRWARMTDKLFWSLSIIWLTLPNGRKGLPLLSLVNEADLAGEVECVAYFGAEAHTWDGTTIWWGRESAIRGAIGWLLDVWNWIHARKRSWLAFKLPTLPPKDSLLTSHAFFLEAPSTENTLGAFLASRETAWSGLDLIAFAHFLDGMLEPAHECFFVAYLI